MPTALVAGSFEPADPGVPATIAAIRRALPGWSIAASGGDGASSPANGPGSRALAGLRDALRADATILVGNVFDPSAVDRHPVRAPLTGALGLAAAGRLRRGRRAIVGASAAPLRTPAARLAARALVRQTGLLVLRDDESAEVLAEAGVQAPFRVGADPAWTELADPVDRGAAEGATVAIIDATAPLVERLVMALGPLADAGHRLRLLPWTARPHDRRAADWIAAQLDDGTEIAAPPRDLRDARRELAGSTAAVALGYYPLLAATAARVPAIAIGREPGLAGLARRLGRPLLEPAFDPAALTAAVFDALGEPPLADEAVRSEIDSAGHGLSLLRLLLSGGRSEDPSELDGLPLEPVPGR